MMQGTNVHQGSVSGITWQGKSSFKPVLRALKKGNSLTLTINDDEYRKLQEFFRPYGVELTTEGLKSPSAKVAAKELFRQELRRVRRKVLWLLGGATAVTAAVTVATATFGGAAPGVGIITAEASGLSAFVAFTSAVTVAEATAMLLTAITTILLAVPTWIWSTSIICLLVVCSWAILRDGFGVTVERAEKGWKVVVGSHPKSAAAAAAN